mgnify:CR=1 FL=1
MAAPAAVRCQEVLLSASWLPAAGQAKTAATEVSLPFFDDFSDYCGAPAADRWEAGGALVNTGFGPFPPTVGMLTLDAYDADGRLYPQATTSLFSADTAMSLPVRLDSLTPADSVVMSFYYLPGGGSGNLWERVGDTPDDSDSLFLDFYAPADSQWHTVWCRGGVSVDSLVAQTGHSWQYVVVPITDSMYFDSVFRFRFRNYCSLQDNGKPGMAGGGDQWNIDYVVVDRGRDTAAVPEFRDVAFVGPAPSMLAHYQAMPARQYRADEMAQSISLTIANLYSSPLATQYGYAVLDADGDTLYGYDGGYENAPAFLPDGTYQSAPAHATPAVGFAFETGDTPCEYTIVHTVREGVGGDAWQQNDTVRFRQTFGDYYAYDDGTAENGYGLTSTSSRIYLAYRFDLNVQDTLTAVAMMFNRTLGAQNESIQFYLTVWQAGDDGKPGTVLYKDEGRRRPQTGGFGTYVLEHPVLVEGSVFVGFEQVGNYFVNIGFDRNTNSCDRIFYLTSTEWQQSILSGSLLLRPRFGTAATVGVEAPSAERLVVYPNPATDMVHIVGDCREWQLYDSRGGMRLCGRGGTMDVDGLPSGLYILRVFSSKGDAVSTKVIVHH